MICPRDLGREVFITSGRGWQSKKWCKRHDGDGRVISDSIIVAVATRKRWVWRTKGAYACAMPTRRNLAQGTRTVRDRLCWVGGMPRLRFSGTFQALRVRESWSPDRESVAAIAV